MTIKSSDQLEYEKLHKQVIIQARNCPKAFIEYVLDPPRPSCKMHHEWQDFISNNDSGIIISFRGAGKSDQITTGRVLWELGRNPNLRIKIAAQSDDRAGIICSALGDHITSNKRLHEVFPDLVPAGDGAWTKTKLTVKRTKVLRDPSIHAAGVASSVTGGRADILFGDDVVDLRNAINVPAMRETVKNAWYSNYPETNHQVFSHPYIRKNIQKVAGQPKKKS